MTGVQRCALPTEGRREEDGEEGRAPQDCEEGVGEEGHEEGGTAQGSQEGRPAQGREESPGQEGPAQGRNKEVTSLSPTPATRERGWGKAPALRPPPHQIGRASSRQSGCQHR